MLEKTSYGLLKDRKPNIIHLVAFVGKCLFHNNEKKSRVSLIPKVMGEFLLVTPLKIKSIKSLTKK